MQGLMMSGTRWDCKNIKSCKIELMMQKQEKLKLKWNKKIEEHDSLEIVQNWLTLTFIFNFETFQLIFI